MHPKAIIAALSIGGSLNSLGAVLFTEQFDGNGADYNVNSTTALAGENDWVDFSNRITVSDIGGVEGYTTAAGGTETVLAGSSNSNDPQIRNDFSIGIAKADITGFTLRIRIDNDDNGAFDDALVATNFDLFWGANAYGNPGATNNSDTNTNAGLAATPTLTAQTNGWYLVDWAFAAGTLTAGTDTNLNSIRIDPTNSPAGSGDSFEIDYFTIVGVPEPGSSTLVALGALTVCLRRRRQR